MEDGIKKTTKYETEGGIYDSLEEAKYEMTLEALGEKAATYNTAKAMRCALDEGLYPEILNVLKHYKIWFDSTRTGEI